MELLGVWKLKEMLTADEDGIRHIGREEIAALEDNEDNADTKRLLRANFVLTETSLDTYYPPLEEEMPMVEEEGWELTEYGVRLDSYPAKIEDGVLLLDYDRNGEEYFPVPVDEDGCLIISDGMMKLQKA